MHVNKKWKEHKEIVQEGFEALGMANPKEDLESYGRNQTLEAKNGTKIHYWISTSTSVQEKKVDVLNNKFSPR